MQEITKTTSIRSTSYNPFLDNELSNFKNTINLYMREADELIGATHIESKDLGTITRDLTDEKHISENNKYRSYVYSNMAISTTRLRAIVQLINIENLNEVQKKEMKLQIYEHYKQITNDLSNELEKENVENARQEASKLKTMQREFNTKVYKILKINNIHKNCTSKIDILNGMQNMNFEKKTIITEYFIDNEKRYKRIITEIPIQPLSNDAKRRIENGDYIYDKWYTSLNSFQKQIFELYKKQILDDKPIPNMINFLPGIRGCFRRTDKIIDTRDNDKIIARSQLIHSAHPAVIKNKDSENLTRNNIKHLQKTTGKKIFLLGLISPSIFMPREKIMNEELKNIVSKNKKAGLFEIIKRNFLSTIQKILGKNKINIRIKKQEHKLIHYGNIPINIFKIALFNLFVKRDINKILHKSLTEIIQSEKTPNAQNIQNLKIRDLIKIIEGNCNMTNPRYKQILKIVKSLDNNLNHMSRTHMIKNQLFGKNNSLEINSNICLLIDLISQYTEMEVVLFCKSGKDRTGIQTEYSSAKILYNKIKNKKCTISEKELLYSSVKSNHLYFINGSQYGGNGAGFNGIKYSPMNVQSDDFNLFKENLYLQSASSNHFQYYGKIISNLKSATQFMKMNEICGR